jgi:hypothetical protein
MICMAMYGNGVRIIGMIITQGHLVMAVPGWIKKGARAGSCAVARGSALPGSAGRHAATGASPTSGTTTWGSG